jgi:hypothetical protein
MRKDNLTLKYSKENNKFYKNALQDFPDNDPKC